MKPLLVPTYRINKTLYVNIFDLADIIIYFHTKANIRINLPRLLGLLFFYKIQYSLPPSYRETACFEEEIEVKNNYVYIHDINQKYKKYKSESLPITQVFFDKAEANINNANNKIAKAINAARALTFNFASINDKDFKNEVIKVLREKVDILL